MIRKLTQEDPNILAEIDGQLYRFIYRSATHSGRWVGLAGFIDSPEFSALVDKGMVPAHTPANIDECFEWEKPGDRLAAYNVERIEPFTYRRDWTGAQAAEVALAAIRLNLELIRLGSAFLCNECLDWNFTFRNTHPVMVDTGAFTRDPASMIKMPMALKMLVDRAGINLPKFNYNRTISGAFLNELHSSVKAFKIVEKPTEWDRYGNMQQPKTIDDISPKTEEEKDILGWVLSLGIREILDIGCNAGAFARLFASRGVATIAIDKAANCVNDLYRLADRFSLPITALKIDCRIVNKKTWPPNGLLNHMSRVDADGDWIDRLRSEAVFVSSVTHHLYGDKFDFNKQAELWGQLAKRWLFVEFIEPGEINIRSMKMGAGYTYNAFYQPLQKYFNLVGSRSYMKDRMWYLFEKKL